jgi:hypothetical protein
MQIENLLPSHHEATPWMQEFSGVDSNVNLKLQLKLAAAILAEQSPIDPTIEECGWIQLAQLVLALDDWLRKGEFLPDRWRPLGPAIKKARGDDAAGYEYEGFPQASS